MTYDALIKSYVGRGTHAARPASPNIDPGATAVYYETDTTNTFAWSGSAWVQLNGSGAATPIPGKCDGRLTLTTAVPVTVSDVTGAGTIYFTPYRGSHVSLWNGSAWVDNTFTERSLALTLTSGKNYDVFLYNNSGTLTLELSAAWTNDTTRADALALQDGVYVKSADHTRLFLGTIRATGTNTTEDSLAKRFVWNYFNRTRRALYNTDATASWTYNSTTWRAANGSTTNQVAVVRGLDEDSVSMNFGTRIVMTTANNIGFHMAVAVDSTTAPTSQETFCYSNTASTYQIVISGQYTGYPGLGYHYLQVVEKSENTNGNVQPFGTPFFNLAGDCFA